MKIEEYSRPKGAKEWVKYKAVIRDRYERYAIILEPRKIQIPYICDCSWNIKRYKNIYINEDIRPHIKLLTVDLPYITLLLYYTKDKRANGIRVFASKSEPNLDYPMNPVCMWNIDLGIPCLGIKKALPRFDDPLQDAMYKWNIYLEILHNNDMGDERVESVIDHNGNEIPYTYTLDMEPDCGTIKLKDLLECPVIMPQFKNINDKCEHGIWEMSPL